MTDKQTEPSAPVQRAPHSSGERLPSSDAAGAGAETEQDDVGEVCPDCGEEFWPDIENQKRCEYCEANLHEQYQNTNH